MASVNNTYLVVMDEPFKRYVKTVPSMIGGNRLSSDGKTQVQFILHSNPNTFVYDDEVLEIYSEREDRFLRQSNKGLFQKGLLKEYEQSKPQLDLSNVLSDAEVTDVASMRNIQSLIKRLSEFTSPHTVARILAAAREIGRPIKTLQAIEDRLKELE